MHCKSYANTTDEYEIIPRDLKASNVLLWSLGEGLPDKLPDNDLHVKANVVDYECCMGLIGNGFWRAPEILKQLKDRVYYTKLEFLK